ncbi:MAG: bifunctional riboflavin kinase/FAD synthetase [Clostridia bacterium]
MKKRVIAVGFFDGVHKGHKALTDKVLEKAKEKNCISTVFTFSKHPDTVVLKKEIPMLCSIDAREDHIKQYSGVDEVIFWDFNEEHAKIIWDTFVKDVLINEFNACHIVTGADFIFGYKGCGNAEKLEKLCMEQNIGYDKIDEVFIENERVSSTNIRKFIEKGDIKKANHLLGHNFLVSGEVKHGRKIGRTIGVRTINLDFPKNMQKPANGVYVSCVTIDEKKYKAVTNVGTVPTFLEDENIVVEAHILDFDEDVYGKIATVEFLDFLRYEKKFADIDDLKNTINENINQTIEYFKEHKL